MIKIYQKKVDRKNGDCMQAVIASLFEKNLEDVPKFIEYESWFEVLYKFLKENNYEYQGMRHNKIYTTLNTPTHECFNMVKWHGPSVITKKCLYKYIGVNEYFFASVLSPKYFNWYTGQTATHAVIINKDFNVVHDPNPEYKHILSYPLTNVLGYNGIINIMLINPIE